MNPTADDALTVATQPASIGERRLALALIALLVIATAVTVALHGNGGHVVPSFIPIFVGLNLMSDALSAALLFSLYRIDGQRAILASAVAYLLNTMLIIPYTLTFPGILDIRQLGNEGESAWLWLTWHVGFAVILVAGQMRARVTAQGRRGRAMIRATAITFVFAVIAAVSVALLSGHFTTLVRGGHFYPAFQLLAAATSLLNIAAVVILLRVGRLSTLRLWLIVALVAAALDTALNGLAFGRYSAAWYVGKFEQFATASVVLISMLAAWSAMHVRANALSERLSRTLEQREALQVEFEREHRASTAFQHAALPNAMPAIPGIAFDAVYRAASTDAVVGGDWYDAFRLADGRVVLSVGDVMGSGLAAAVTMNAVRQAVRGAAQIVQDPLEILNAADRALHSERPDAMVTAFVGVLDPITRAFTFASAGHPPALLRSADGSTRALGVSGLPLGLRSQNVAASGQPAQSIVLPDPSLLVLYTDGLTEMTRNVVAGEAQLCAVLADPLVADARNPASAIADALLDHARDDVAILTMRLDGVLLDAHREAFARPPWVFAADDGMRAGAVRRDVAAALAAGGALDDQVLTTELIFSELVGNVLRHAGSAVEVVLDLSPASPVLHVLDRGPGFSFSARLPASPMSESGRGLFIVSTMTNDFSVTPRLGGGSHARAVLPFALPEAG